MSAADALSSFAIEAYKVAYKEGELPAQVMMADVTHFQPETITDLERTQFWTMPDAEDVLQKCRYKLLISDFMAAGLDYKSRSALLADWLEAAVSLFPTCKAICSALSNLITDHTVFIRIEKVLQSLLDLNSELPEGCITWSNDEELLQIVTPLAETGVAAEDPTEE